MTVTRVSAAGLLPNGTFPYICYSVRMKWSQKVVTGTVIVFALIGIVFAGVFVAMQFGWLNVRGTIQERNRSLYSALGASRSDAPSADGSAVVLCKIHELANYAPETAKNIYNVYQIKQDQALVTQMLTVAQKRFLNTDLPTTFASCSRALVPDTTPLAQTAYAWADSQEWSVIRSAFIRDQDMIRQAAKDAGISPRMLLGGIIGEQFRFFTNSRDSFKYYFEPLKILASLSKFSYGIAGLKPETAKRIDEQLKNPASVFYLGKDMENVITYPDPLTIDTTRFDRITDTKNTYYSYLYAGLFMRQVTAQWAKEGYDISNRPEVLSTLYNLGFNRSIPKADPGAGGAPITVNGTEYNFGQLGYEFYYSGELSQEFPY